jgi:hypothetical protein
MGLKVVDFAFLAASLVVARVLAFGTRLYWHFASDAIKSTDAEGAIQSLVILAWFCILSWWAFGGGGFFCGGRKIHGDTL